MGVISKLMTKKQYEIALPLYYCAFAIFFNIFGLASMFARDTRSAIIYLLSVLFMGNFLMFVGYLYILRDVRKWGFE